MSTAQTAPVLYPAEAVRGGSRSARRPLFAAVLAVTAAEAVVAFVHPVAGAIAHAVLLIALLARWISAGEPAVLVLALVPLARVTSLALTPTDYGAVSYVLPGLPLLLAVVWTLRRLRRARLGRWKRPTWHGVLVALSGIPLGYVTYALLDLPTIPYKSSASTIALGLPVVFLFAGVLEELLFRGLVQPTLERPFGPWSIVLADLLFVAAYLPTRDAGLIAVMAVVGLGFGWYVRRTGGLGAVAVAHGLLAAGALVFWPPFA